MRRRTRHDLRGAADGAEQRAGPNIARRTGDVRSSIWLDLDRVDVDVERWFAIADDEGVVDGDLGGLLPGDRYDDGSGPLHDEMRGRFVAAARRRAEHLTGEAAVQVLRRILADDPFGEPSRRALVRALHEDGRPGEARRRTRPTSGRMASSVCLLPTWRR